MAVSFGCGIAGCGGHNTAAGAAEHWRRTCPTAVDIVHAAETRRPDPTPEAVLDALCRERDREDAALAEAGFHAWLVGG